MHSTTTKEIPMYSGDEVYGDDVTSGIQASADEIVDEHYADFEKDEGRAPTRRELADRLLEEAREADDPTSENALRDAAAQVEGGLACSVEFAEPEVEIGQELADAIDATLEAMAELVVALNRADSHIGLFDHFRAYHMADLEGTDAGWLGGPHLVDALRAMRQGEF